jgi:hypothetical protein
MSYNFTELMSKKTDEELITILSARRDEYSEAAIDAAEIEFKKREISLDKIEIVKVEQTAIKEKESANANEPLEKDIKRLAMIFPLIARLMYAEKFRKEGFDRKLEEMTNAYFYGRLLFVGIIIVIIVVIKSF